MKDKLKFIMDGGDVKRFHSMRTIFTETVGHHSHSVGCLVMLLVEEPSAALLKAALLHDMGEQVTGDIPSPAKLILGIKEHVSLAESAFMSNHGFPMPELTEAETKALKMADLASGALFCLAEMQAGNMRMEETFRKFFDYAVEMGLDNELELGLFAAIVDMFEELK